MIDVIFYLVIGSLILLLLGGLFSTALGFLVLIHIAKPKKLPMDESNRINHIRLIWFALTRPEIFVDKFEWLKNDELKNMLK